MSDFNPPLPPYPPAPAVPTLGPAFPMTFGQILDRISRLVRANLSPFLAIGMLPFGIVIALEAVFAGVLYLAGVIPHPPAQPNPTTLALTIVPLFILFVPAMLFIYGLYYGATSYAALQADHDLKVTAAEAFRHAWSRIGRYTWLLLLRSLIVGLPIFVLAILIGIAAMLIVLAQGKSSDEAAMLVLIPFAVLLYLGSLVYAAIMSLRYSLAFPVCVHEGIPAGQALKRSGMLTNGAKGRIFLALLIIYAIGYVCIMVMYVIGIFIAVIVGTAASMGSLADASPLTIAMLVIGGLILLIVVLLWSALLMAAYSTAFAVFYRDQCLRKDGLMIAPAV
jgi:hypothetical protein